MALNALDHDGAVPEAEFLEQKRLDALARYDILDTPREEAFDRIVRLTKRIFDVPVALVSVIDAHRQWYKAYDGLDNCEASRPDTFCTRLIDIGEPLLIPDASIDPRFAQNPFVTGDPGIRAYAGAPLLTPDGYVIGTLCAIDFKPRSFSESDRDMVADLAQLAMDEFELRRTASTDALTGLMSRRSFKETAAREIALALRHRHNLCCVAVDLDHFKSINDRFGHAAGDAVLAGTATTFREQLRQSDLVGRLGGEEFVVLLPHSDRAGGLQTAEKIRTALARQTFALGGEAVRVTASFGVSALDLSTRNVDSLIERADAACYQAKAEGRNRVVGWRAKIGDLVVPGRRVLKGGQIVFNNRHSTVDCTIRTLGDGGAGVDVSSTTGIPDRFDLLIRPEGRIAACSVALRSDNHLEVEFH